MIKLIVATLLAYFFATTAYAQDKELTLHQLTLEGAQEIALQNNKDLDVLHKRLIIAEQQYFQSISGWMPSATVSAHYTRYDAPLVHGMQDAYSANLSLSQAVFSSDKYYSLRLGKLGFQSAEQQLKVAQNDLLFSLRQAYYSIVLNTEQIEIQKENISLLRSALDTEQRKLDLGESTAFEVNQSKVEIASALSEYYQANRNLQFSRNGLIALLGVDPDDETSLSLATKEIPVREFEEIDQKLVSLSAERTDREVIDLLIDRGMAQESISLQIYTDEDVLQWEDLARHYRPDIKWQLLQLKRARKTLASYRSKYLPSVNAFALYHSGTSTKGFSSLKYDWDLGLNFSWSLFDGFAREFRVREGNAALAAAQITYQKLIEQTQLDVRGVFYDLEQALLSYFAAQQGLNHSDEAIQQAKKRLDLGVITPLQYRESVAKYTSTKQVLNRAAYNLLVAYYKLRHIVGVDLDEA